MAAQNRIEIDGNDLASALQAQRNEAQDSAANNAAAIQTLLRTLAAKDEKIADLEKQIADANKPRKKA